MIERGVDLDCTLCVEEIIMIMRVVITIVCLFVCINLMNLVCSAWL